MNTSRDENHPVARVGRPVDRQHREELLDGVVAYAVERGLANLTWRPVAAALGVSTTALVHRFGSKERMLQEVQRRLRERILMETAPSPGADVAIGDIVRMVWDRTSDPRRAGEFRLFFATYGLALQAPDQFAEFLGHVVADPTRAFASVISGEDGREKDAVATLAIAALRGLLLDLLTTGDTARVHAALEILLDALDPEAAGTR